MEQRRGIKRACFEAPLRGAPQHDESWDVFSRHASRSVQCFHRLGARAGDSSAVAQSARAPLARLRATRFGAARRDDSLGRQRAATEISEKRVPEPDKADRRRYVVKGVDAGNKLDRESDRSDRQCGGRPVAQGRQDALQRVFVVEPGNDDDERDEKHEHCAHENQKVANNLGYGFQSTLTAAVCVA